MYSYFLKNSEISLIYTLPVFTNPNIFIIKANRTHSEVIFYRHDKTFPKDRIKSYFVSYIGAEYLTIKEFSSWNMKCFHGPEIWNMLIN